MNPKLAILTLTLAALACCGGTAAAQAPLSEVTLDQALSLFRRHSPELQIARSQLSSSLGNARQGRAVPNLAAQLTHEDLGGYSESYLLFTQRLDFLWEHGRRGNRAEAWTGAATARFMADSTRLATGMKRTFVVAWERAEAVVTFERAQEVVGEVMASAEARVSEGDLAGYDLRRLRWENARMARRLAVAELDLEDAERGLGAQVTEDAGGARVGAVALDAAGPPSVSDPDVVITAVAGRPELQAARSTVQGARGRRRPHGHLVADGHERHRWIQASVGRAGRLVPRAPAPGAPHGPPGRGEGRRQRRSDRGPDPDGSPHPGRRSPGVASGGTALLHAATAHAVRGRCGWGEPRSC